MGKVTIYIIHTIINKYPYTIISVRPIELYFVSADAKMQIYQQNILLADKNLYWQISIISANYFISADHQWVIDCRYPADISIGRAISRSRPPGIAQILYLPIIGGLSVADIWQI